ncbi:MAG: alanine dehydrogenase, partial [Anaerolineae bacterium]|nr:alanine dehydrogenase [Anaerolineae bacterium]
MDFGIPKEVRDLEKRVGLTPAGVVSLIKRGQRVYLERGAGADAGFRDDHYEQAGAQIVYTAE